MGAGGRRRKVVFVVGAAAIERERVAATVRSRADVVRQCVTLSEVNAALIAESAAVIVIVREETPTPLLVSAIRRFHIDDPATAMLLCLRPSDRSVRELATLARAGLDDFVILGDPQTGDQLLTEVARRLKHAIPVELVRRVCPQVDDDPYTICTYCFRDGFRNLKVTQVADWWRRDPRTVNRQLTKAGLRSFEYIIDYARLLHVAYRLDDTPAGPGALARLLDYPSSSALANDVRHWTGCSPSALQSRGAIDTAVRLVRTGIEPTGRTLLLHKHLGQHSIRLSSNCRCALRASRRSSCSR